MLRLFGSFFLAILNTARALIYFVMRIFSFIANIVGLLGIIGIIMSIRSWMITGWNYSVKVMLLSSLIIFGMSFIYHLVMYIVAPRK